MNNKIKFGTDGFRGIRGKDFTFDNVKKITLAIAQYLKSGTVIIGYDPREEANKFAEFSANILADLGFFVILSKKVVPTPVVAYMAKNLKDSQGAIMFTASHNPKEYLGIKFIPNYGGPATSDITKEIEDIIEKNHYTIEKGDGAVVKADFTADYFRGLEKLIDFESIKNAGLKILYDGLFSASVGYFDVLLKNKKIDFEAVNDKYDPNFGGFLPEPKKEYLSSKQNYITVANDGDADRYGVVDEKGNYVSPNIIMAILLKYLKEKGMEGVLVKTVGVSQIVDVVAQKLNVEVIETPVGFKYVGAQMRMNKAILGGEDSGGLTTGNHISEKDGIYANLLILEAMSKTGKKLYELEEDIINFANVKFVQDRVDIKLDDDALKDKIIDNINQKDAFCNMKIIKKTNIDGTKLFLEDNTTKILIRKSGTEPLLRFYIETDSNLKINSLKEFIKGYIYALN